MAAHWALLSLGFLRQEYWRGLPFPSPMNVWMLSHYSHVPLVATLWTAAYQAPLSMGFSRQEHWSGLPFPSPMHESEKWKWSRSVMSDSLQPHGLQPIRLLRPWDFLGKSTGVGAIAFSDLYKYTYKYISGSCFVSIQPVCVFWLEHLIHLHLK